MRITRYTSGISAIHKGLGVATKGILSYAFPYIEEPSIVYILEQEPFEQMLSLIGGKTSSFIYPFGVIIGSKTSEISRILANITGSKTQGFEEQINLIADKFNLFEEINQVIADKKYAEQIKLALLGDKKFKYVLEYLLLGNKKSEFTSTAVVKGQRNIIPILQVLDLL